MAQSKVQNLADFEKSVLNNIWDDAQDIMQKGGVMHLHEAEKHFWTARVFDGMRSYEVEILLTGRRIKGFTCDCWIEHRTLMCKHVAATAGTLRQFLEQKEAEKRERKIEAGLAPGTDRLNIATVIKKAPPEALARFVQEYAAQDKAFAMLLKSRFAGMLTGDENYYSTILKGIVPQKKDVSLGLADVRKVHRIVDDLVRQQKGAVAEADTQKAWLIAEALIHQLPELITKMQEVYREPYLQVFQNAFLFILRLEKHLVSPELWERRLEFTLSMLANPALTDSAMRMLITTMHKEKGFVVGAEQRFTDAQPPIPFGVLLAYIVVLIDKKMSGGLDEVFRHFVKDQESAVRMVIQLYHLNYLKEALAMGKMVATYPDLTLMQKNTLGQIMLSAAEKLDNKKELSILLYDRLLLTGNMEYYDQLKGSLQKDWAKHYEVIIGKLKKHKDMKLLCMVFMHEKDFDQLFELLLTQNNFTLVHQLERTLAEHAPDRLVQLYISLFEEYLAVHFGAPSADFVRGHLLTLLKQGGAEAVKEIIANLSHKYPERQALLDAFQEIFPKYRRVIKPFVG